MMMLGTACGGWQMARAALVADRLLQEGAGDTAFNQDKLATARFYAEHYLPRTEAHLNTVQAGASSAMALSEDRF